MRPHNKEETRSVYDAVTGVSIKGRTTATFIHWGKNTLLKLPATFEYVARSAKYDEGWQGNLSSPL